MTYPTAWQEGDYLGPRNDVHPATAVPDMGEANAAVAASGGNRDGHGVLDVPNMSNPGTHSAGS